MATVKVTLDTRSTSRTKDNKFPIVLRLGHKSKTRDIPFNVQVLKDQFDESACEITGIKNAVRRSKRMQKTYGDIDLWLDENKADIKLWSIVKLKDKIEREFFKKQSTLTVLNHAGKFFYRKTQEGDFSTVSSYESAVKMFVKYRMKLVKQNDFQTISTLYEKDRREGFIVKPEYVPFDMAIKAFDIEFAKDFRAYCQGRGNAKNTVNIYLRSLQSILNDAEGTYPDLKGHRPLDSLKKTSTENEPVVLTMDEINSIRDLDLVPDSSYFHVRNYFLFMFNNMGMNFYDVALAKAHQFDGERFSYTRKKTEKEGDYFSIIQNDENLEIIKHYAQGKEKNDYMFPLIPTDTPEHLIFKVKDNKANWFRKNMKKIAPLAGIEKNVTTYTARDTWTNIGLEMGIDIRKVSAGLGHSSIEITEKHYSQSIQAKLLDEINKQITNSPKPL